MAPTERVLKFDRSDDESTYVLVNVVHKGPKPLDIKVQATEGYAEYASSLKHDKVGSLRVKNCPASEPEWQQILDGLLQQEPQADIQATATVSDGSDISIVVRKSIQGITQRLGSITIPVVEGGELNVLDWCATAVDAAAKTKKAAFEASVKAAELEAEVADLKAQLEELIKAKDEDETSLLLKFRDLLNEKKIKIREQQKIIASKQLKDEVTASPPRPSQIAIPERSRKADTSRRAKRKAPVAVEEDSSDGFEPMEVDKVKTEQEDTDRETETDGTASTASDDDEPAGEGVSEANTAASSQQNKSAPKKGAAQPPPKRSLPFVKSKTKPAPGPAAGAAGSETESDDEL